MKLVLAGLVMVEEELLDGGLGSEAGWDWIARGAQFDVRLGFARLNCGDWSRRLALFVWSENQTREIKILIMDTARADFKAGGGQGNRTGIIDMEASKLFPGRADSGL